MCVYGAARHGTRAHSVRRRGAYSCMGGFRTNAYWLFKSGSECVRANQSDSWMQSEKEHMRIVHTTYTQTHAKLYREYREPSLAFGCCFICLRVFVWYSFHTVLNAITARAAITTTTKTKIPMLKGGGNKYGCDKHDPCYQMLCIYTQNTHERACTHMPRQTHGESKIV